MADLITQLTRADAGVQVSRVPRTTSQRTVSGGNLGAYPSPPDPMFNQGVGYWILQRNSDGIGDAAITEVTAGIGSAEIKVDSSNDGAFEVGEGGTKGPQGNFMMNERPNVGYNRKDRGIFRLFSPHVHNWNGE